LYVVLGTLQKALDNSVGCRHCGSNGVILERTLRNGIGEKIHLRCQNSDCILSQSPTEFTSTPKTNKYFEINRAEVLAFRIIGRGYRAARKVHSVLNLSHPVHRNPWSGHSKAIDEHARESLEEELSLAASQLREYQGADSETMIDVGVSLDGSWSSRGWSARDGVVAAISIDTGKVLDVE